MGVPREQLHVPVRPLHVALRALLGRRHSDWLDSGAGAGAALGGGSWSSGAGGSTSAGTVLGGLGLFSSCFRAGGLFAWGLASPAQPAHSDHPPIWVLSSPEAGIPLAFVDELDDEEGQEIVRLLRRRWARPQRVLVRYEAQTHTVLSYLCEIVQRASERSYLGKRGLKILIRDSPGSQPGIPRFGK